MAPGSLHSSIQHAILTAADRVNLKWPGLPAATWAKLQNDAAEADRIEFLGDAVVRLVLSHEVYKRYPTEGPGLYTKVVQALYSNLTFYSLLDRPEANGSRLRMSYDPRHGQGQQVVPIFNHIQRSVFKPVGDKFESVVGAFYLEYGLADLEKWLIKLFDPLIVAAYQEFKRCEQLGLYGLQRTEGSVKRPSATAFPLTPSSTQKRPRIMEARRPYATQYKQAREDASWWQKLASAAGQKLGGGAFQHYEFTFQAPKPANNSTLIPSTSNASTSTIVPQRYNDVPIPGAVTRLSYASVVSQANTSTTRVVAPLPRRAGGNAVLGSNPQTAVPKPRAPVVIDLTLEDEIEPSSTQVLATAQPPAISATTSSARTQSPRTRALHPVTRSSAMGSAIGSTEEASDVFVVGQTREVIIIDDDDHADNPPKCIAETRVSPERPDLSAMDISYGFNNDYILLPPDSDSDEEHPSIGPAYQEDKASPLDLPDSEDDDEKEMTEVEQLLDWIAKLGPAVDRVDMALPSRGPLPSASDRTVQNILIEDRPRSIFPLESGLSRSSQSGLVSSQSFMPAFIPPSLSSKEMRLDPLPLVKSVLANFMGSPRSSKDTANKTAASSSAYNIANENNVPKGGPKTKRATRTPATKMPKSTRGASAWALPRMGVFTHETPSSSAGSPLTTAGEALPAEQRSKPRATYAQALRFDPMRRR